MKKQKQLDRARVWLSYKSKKSGGWKYGLVRLRNGMIVISEIWGKDYPYGHRLGHCCRDGVQRLVPGEKKTIITDLYIACAEWLEKNGGVPVRRAK